MRRAMMVVLPPGGNGTIHRIGLLGYLSWPNAENDSAIHASTTLCDKNLENSTRPVMIAPPRAPTMWSITSFPFRSQRVSCYGRRSPQIARLSHVSPHHPARARLLHDV